MSGIVEFIGEVTTALVFCSSILITFTLILIEVTGGV